jgi:FdhD protein
MSDRVSIVSVVRIAGGHARTDQDLVAAEAPVSVHLYQPDTAPPRPFGVLMRTPGDDADLVLGLLHGEGVIRSGADVTALRHRPGPPGENGPEAAGDVIEVELASHVDLQTLTGRALASTSACGLCGRLELHSVGSISGAAAIATSAEVISRLPDALRSQQAVFAETGGLHAAALFDLEGTCLTLREDVGRHNAVDKVIGSALASGRLPATHSILAVSGRVAFEIVQKAVLAGIPLLVAVGAPSSLAVDAARASGLTLVGFVRDGRFNIYTRPDRVR